MEPLDRISLAEQAAEAIKRWILTHHLQGGDPLPSERQLCDGLGVSRTILREALSALVSQRIVSKVPGKGMFVGDFDRSGLGVHIWLTLTDEAGLAALRDLRYMLEMGALELVVERSTPEDLAALELKLRETERRLSQGEQIGELDTEFHLALFGMAHVPALYDLYAQILRDSTAVTVFQNPQVRDALTPDVGMANLSLLRQVVDALREGDLCQAQRAMKEHIAVWHETAGAPLERGGEMARARRDRNRGLGG